MHDRAWYERHPLAVAFDLLGQVFVVERDGTCTSGRIVEVEAYAGPDDLASHSGRLKRARPMLFGEVGRLYMYRSYGIHTMLNIVAHEPGTAGAILIRALEPVDGIAIMQARRSVEFLRSLTRGPGVLCQALGLRLDDNDLDLLVSREIRLESGTPAESVVAGPRIGITRSVEHPWRLFDADSPFVSAHRRGVPVTRDDLQYIVDA
jgi:DNA-3-methyladenine glycosylase